MCEIMIKSCSEYDYNYTYWLLNFFFSFFFQPSVREMSSLLEQNRKLREELRQVATERNQLSDRVKTLECQVSESLRPLEDVLYIRIHTYVHTH